MSMDKKNTIAFTNIPGTGTLLDRHEAEKLVASLALHTHIPQETFNGSEPINSLENLLVSADFNEWRPVYNVSKRFNSKKTNASYVYVDEDNDQSYLIIPRRIIEIKLDTVREHFPENLRNQESYFMRLVHQFTNSYSSNKIVSQMSDSALLSPVFSEIIRSEKHTPNSMPKFMLLCKLVHNDYHSNGDIEYTKPLLVIPSFEKDDRITAWEDSYKTPRTKLVQ